MAQRFKLDDIRVDENLQVMPSLEPHEYEALRADIKDNGIQLPIVVDEDGTLIDGFNRLKIARELRIKAPQKVVKAFETDDEKRSYARRINMIRRHLSREEKREIIKGQLKETWKRSDRDIGRVLGVDHKTVGAVRRELETGGEIPHQDKVTGKNGVQQIRKKASKTPTKALKQEPEKIEPEEPTLEEYHLAGKFLAELTGEFLEELEQEPKKQISEAVTIILNFPWNGGHE